MSISLRRRLSRHFEWVLDASGIPYWFDNGAIPRERGPQFDALVTAGIRWARISRAPSRNER